MTGASAPVIHGVSSAHVHVIPDLTHPHVDMDMTGRQRCATPTYMRIHTALIHSPCTVRKSVQSLLTTSSPRSKEAPMIGITYRGYAVDAITRSIMSMVQSNKGVGAKKVFVRGWRPAGQSCAFTREIRQGGV